MREDDDAFADRAQGPIYGVEHSLAWLMALAAIVLGVIGLLVGFDVLDLRSGENGLGIGDAQGSTALPGSFLDGAMWLFAGISAAVLAFALHANEHHQVGRFSTMSAGNRSMASLEHVLAYVTAVGSIALLAIGLIVGYGAFDVDDPQLDGLLWIWAGFGSSALTAALHAVRHHQTVEADEMIAIVEERVRLRQGPVSTEPQRRPIR